MKPIVVYLDWNIFNKIEKRQTLPDNEQKIYLEIEAALLQKKIISPYSNAHISDLIRGYLKNPSYIEEHLQTLRRLTHNLCLTQYWGETKPKWHIREVGEFFKSTLNERSHIAANFYSLFDFEDALAAVHRLRCDLMQLQPVDKIFQEIYKEDPVFNSIYPRTKMEMNQYALCEDLYTFSEKIKSDYTLYKNYRKYLIQLKLKFPQLANIPGIAMVLKTISASQPKQITWDALWEDSTSIFKSTSNPAFDKLFDYFIKTDLKGYRPDERFANLIDDALHVYYGSNCDYFVTIDERCFDKAKVVYSKFAPKTSCLKVEAFYDLLAKIQA